MNAQDYAIEQLRPGLSASFQVTLTREMVDAFVALSGDDNPLHVDAEYARACGYRDRVVHGLLTSSFCSRLAGMYIPGRRCLLRGVDLEFTRPVYEGDQLTVHGEISHISETVRHVDLKIRIANQEDLTVVRGVLRAGVLADELPEDGR